MEFMFCDSTIDKIMKWIDLPTTIREVSQFEYMSWSVTKMKSHLNETLVITSQIDSIAKLKKPDGINLLVSKGYVNSSRDIDRFYYSFSRLIFRPRMRIVCKANQEFPISIRDQQYAFQFRMGGKAANSNEKKVFLQESQFPMIIHLIEDYAKPHPNCSIYLSSDSNPAIDYISTHLNTSCVVTHMSSMKRGHSSSFFSGSNSLENMEGAIYDLIVLSRSKSIVFTMGSSYGAFGSALCRCHSSFIRPAWNVGWETINFLGFITPDIYKSTLYNILK